MTMTDMSRLIRIGAVALVTWMVVPSTASAQGYISPLIGYDFGGDSGCPEVTNCENRKLNWGVSVGSLGSILGSELELAYAKNFFGEIPGVSSSVLTLMGNGMVAPRFGPVQPYWLIGLGLMKTHVEFATSSVLGENSENNFAWDTAGGLMVFFGRSVGIRGEIRHYHAFQDREILGLRIANTKLDYGRVAAGVVFRF
jgi:opacity protein-like surface antigen